LIEKNMLLMSLWSFQGARELEPSPPGENTAVTASCLRRDSQPAAPISQNSTAHWRHLPPR